MKKLFALLLAVAMLASLCAFAEEETETGPSIVEAVNYCQVLDCGEAITAIRLEYSEPIAMNAMFGGQVHGGWDLSIPYATTSHRAITSVYTNTTGVKGDVEGAGQYVFIELDTSFEDRGTYKDFITFDEAAKTRALFPISVAQTRDLTTVNGNVVPMGNVTTASEIRELVDDFEVIKWVYEETGVEYDLLLYVPEGYDGSEAFPLVVHFTNGGDASYTDNSGNRLGGLFTHTDAITWADPESQAKNPSFVLAFGKDLDAEITADVQMAMIQYVLDNYNVDTNRIYAVSLAGATPRLFECALANPDMFAALVYCSYDPIHVWKDVDLATENYLTITETFPTWGVVSEADTTGAMEGIPAELQGAGKGARLGNFALMLNEEHGANITVAANGGDMPMWNGLLRGSKATELAEELVSLGEAKNSDDFVSVFIAGTTPYVDHWSWANGYINMGLHDWLYKQSK